MNEQDTKRHRDSQKQFVLGTTWLLEIKSTAKMVVEGNFQK